jgi:D-galactarolactone cycloisomerase
MISEEAIDLALPDVPGRLTVVIEIAALCEAHGIEFAPHCALFGPGRVAAIHLTSLPEWLFCGFEADVYGQTTT